MEENRKKGWLLLGLVAGILLLFFLLAGLPMLRLARNPVRFRAQVRENGIGGILLLGAFILLQTMSGFFPGGPVQAAAGFAFGGVLGALICTFFSTLGNLLACLTGRRFGTRIVTALLSEDQLSRIRRMLKKDRDGRMAFWIMLIPATPKDLYAWFAGFTASKHMARWTLETFLARFPAIFLAAYSGQQLGEKNYKVFWFLVLLIAVSYLAGSRIYRSREISG